jgi:hypothetical protein
VVGTVVTRFDDHLPRSSSPIRLADLEQRVTSLEANVADHEQQLGLSGPPCCDYGIIGTQGRCVLGAGHDGEHIPADALMAVVEAVREAFAMDPEYCLNAECPGSLRKDEHIEDCWTIGILMALRDLDKRTEATS